MIKLKNLITEEIKEAMVPVQGVVAEFVDGVNELARLSPDGAAYRNDVGFNGTHAAEYFRNDKQYFQGASSIPLPILVKWINGMKTYKNTQNPYSRSYDDVVKDLRMALQPYFPKQTQTSDSDTKVVKLTNKPEKFGKLTVYITDGEKVFPRNRKWIAALRDWFEANNIGEEQDNYGNWKHPVYKYFQKDKNEISGNTYQIHPGLFKVLSDFFKQNYSEYKVELNQSSLPPAEKPKEKDKLKIVFTKDTANLSLWKPENGWVLTKLAKQLNIYGKGTLMSIPSENTDPYTGNPEFFYTGIWHGKENAVISALDKDGTYDTSELKNYVKKISTTTSSSRRLSFEIKDNNIYVKAAKWKNQDPEAHELLKDFMKFSFPVSDMMKGADKVGVDRSYSKINYSHVIKSKDLNSLFSFYKLLKDNNFKEDAIEFHRIMTDMKKNGFLESDKVDGMLDEYNNDADAFYEDAKSTLPQKVTLYPKQLHGVRHLFSRKSALLGDETGVGKTAQVVVAANLRMKETGGKCLIITLNSTTKQWATEIMKFSGAGTNEIEIYNTKKAESFSPKKWTIMYYENFQRSGNKLDMIGQKLKNAGFTVVAFDEIHKIKHQDAKRSEVIHALTANIPYKWGASATMAANKPLDIKNQLRVLGHRMGDVSSGFFGREFAGKVAGGYGGAYIDGPRETQIEAAMKFRRWLANSGLYIRRSKKEVNKDMPNLDRNIIDINFTPSELQQFEQRKKEISKDYIDPSLALSDLLASRQAVAEQKVPYTVKRVIELVSKGEKVVVFTAFIEAGRMLVNQISNGVKKLNPEFEVGRYTSDTKDRVSEKEQFIKNPNVKVLVMSIKVGGTGVDFPHGVNHMIVNDFDWTPEQAEQSEGRIFRISSTDDKHVEYIISQNTVDRELFDIVSQKREISEILQTDLTKAYENPEDESLAADIYDKMEKLDKLTDKMKELEGKK